MDTPTTIKNAEALGKKWGSGPSKSAAEVFEFKAAMRTVGLTDGQACVLAAWMGGYPADAWHVIGDTAESECKRSMATVPSVDDALTVLKKRSPLLAGLVVAKAKQKGWEDWKKLAANSVQATKMVAKDTAKASVKLAKDTAKATKTVVKTVAKEAKEAVIGVQEGLGELASNSAKNFWRVLGDLVPTWLVVLLIVIAVAGIGGFLWLQTRGPSAGLQAVAGLVGSA